jgi:uncharacterized protein (DUF1015 family)
MAEIIPFKAYRYTERAGEFASLVGPLQEIRSNEKEANYYSVRHLTSTPAAEMGELMMLWKKEGMIAKDPVAAIYVYYQYFYEENATILSCRKGFICLLKIQDWQDNVILKHEDILHDIKMFQASMLENAQMHVNPIHGLFRDEENFLEASMDESILNPVLVLKDSLGVIHKLSMIHDKKCIDTFIKCLRNKKIVIADGHHRYSAALEHAKNMSAKKTSYLPAFLTNTVNNHISLLPLFRVLRLPSFSEETFLRFLRHDFIILEEKNIYLLQKAIRQKLYTFGLITKKTSYIIELKSEVSQIKHPYLNDLRIVDEWIFDKLPGFDKTQESVKYLHAASDCLEEINSGRADIAILVKEITVNEVIDLSEKGIVLPEKSTYFYPKILGGIVMSSTDSTDGEIESPCYVNI